MAIDKSRDTRWSRAIRNRDKNKCIHCGETEAISAAHLNGRHNLRTRWLLENGITACDRLHRAMEQSEQRKRDILKRYKLLDKYDKIMMISKGIKQPKNFGYIEVE